MSELTNQSDIIKEEEDEYIKKSRAVDSDEEDFKDNQENQKPSDYFQKSSPFSGFGIKSQQNNTEKIEINEEKITTSIKRTENEQNLTNSPKPMVNDNSFFKPSNLMR
jgi:hypothetical protein